jgi:uncharacterized lipoprotein NlpE involved in copper resistance
MKKIFLFFAIVLTLCGCNNDDNNNETLPPATQTGAGTFACFVNGKPFIDKSGGYFNCFYQFVDGEYYFSISGESDNQELCDINFGTNGIEIIEGGSYTLLSSGMGNASANIFFCNEVQDYETNDIYRGKLTITKLDFEDNIISGTFNFTILNTQTNTEFVVTEGRFDTLFTQ